MNYTNQQHNNNTTKEGNKMTTTQRMINAQSNSYKQLSKLNYERSLELIRQHKFEASTTLYNEAKAYNDKACNLAIESLRVEVR